MAEGNWSVIRVEKISAEGAQKTERHNERKNESYANLNVDTEQIARNVHFKDTGGLTYNEYFQRLIDEGKISTRGQKAGATVFNELVIDVNTRYFEEHGGYEYANFISWNGNAAKLDIREWHPNHERCGKGITLTEDEGRKLYAALKAIYEKE